MANLVSAGLRVDLHDHRIGNGNRWSVAASAARLMVTASVRRMAQRGRGRRCPTRGVRRVSQPM